MPSSVSTVTVKSLMDYIRLIERTRKENGGELWYRGCNKCDYPLTPTLYRRPDSSIEQLLQAEVDIMTRFKQRSVPYLSRIPATDWEYLFLMQHSGVPTRLLDWTENPYVALYFAIAPVAGVDDRDSPENAAVWVLKPGPWNRAALQHISYKGGVLSTGDSLLGAYAPASQLDLMPNHVLAIYGTHNSPRIVAQRGVFTLFGRSTHPMEQLADNNANFADLLFRIRLPTSSLPSLRESLYAMGIAESVIFPELDGLAKELKRVFGYGA